MWGRNPPQSCLFALGMLATSDPLGGMHCNVCMALSLNDMGNLFETCSTSTREMPHPFLISLSSRHEWDKCQKDFPCHLRTKPCGNCEACHPKGQMLQACPKQTNMIEVDFFPTDHIYFYLFNI